MKRITLHLSLFIGIVSVLNAGTIKRDMWVPISVSTITTFVPYKMILPDRDNDGIEDSVDTPVAYTQNITVDADSSGYNITLRGVDNDSPLSYIIVAQPAHGQLLGEAPNLIYIPNDGYEGSDSFTFKVSDGVHESQIATINIFVGTYLPTCDSTNPEVLIIGSTDDWIHINDTNKSIFCVNPGDYSNLNITITSSGTKQKRRFLLLNTPNNIHPAKMVNSFVHKDGWLDKIAKYRIKLENADYWMIDRLAYWEDPNPFDEVITLHNSSHNIIRRALIVDTSSGIGLSNGSNDNKIEKTHMEKTQWSVDYAKDTLENGPFDDDGDIAYDHRIFADLAAIGLIGENNSSMINNVFSDNEIINYTDAIQLVRNTYNGIAQNIDFSGTKIRRNTLYVTPLLYTDCNGTFETNGRCSVSENAIDIKAGAHDENNPIIIENNVIFGFKQADDTYSDLDDVGTAIVTHYHVANLIIKDNLIFESHNGFGSDGPLENKIALANVTMSDNTLYNIGGQTYINDENETVIASTIFTIAGNTQQGIYNGAKDVNITNNTIANNNEFAGNKFYNTDNLKLDNNVYVNSNGFWTPVGCEDGYEDYSNLYNRGLSISHNTFYTDDPDAPDSIPGCAGRDTNTFTRENYDFSQINQTYTVRKFTTHSKTMDLIEPRTPVVFTSRQRNVSDKIISIFENGTTEIQYGYAAVVEGDEVHGITAGRLGFTSATGDMRDFIENYYNSPPLSSYLTELKRLEDIYAANGYELSESEEDCQESTSSCYVGGLDGLVEDWNASRNIEAFKEAQDRYLDDHYFTPALLEAQKNQMSLPISLLCFYDTAIQHGVEGLKAIVSQVSLSAPKSINDEITWLKAFNQKRIDVLQSKPYWKDTLYRVHTLNDLIEDQKYDLNITQITIRDWEDETFAIGE